MSLKDYNRKRDFAKTPEPPGKPEPDGQGHLRFVVQLHRASRLHSDFRIELDGVFKSWAVPKGVTLNPNEQHLAIAVEDHPLPYGDFEGIIPPGNYGAGTVMIWDRGTYVERQSQGRRDSEVAVRKGLAEGHLSLLMEGEKLRGEFTWIRLKDRNQWLLIKKRDAFASYKEMHPVHRSVTTGRTLEEISQQAETKGQIWLPARTQEIQETPTPKTKPDRKPPPGVPLHGLPRLIPKAPMLRRVKPMLPTPWPTPFVQKGWIFELDHGGYRALAEVEPTRIRLYSKQLLPFEIKFPTIAQALRDSFSSTASNPVWNEKSSAVLDGEIWEGVFWIYDLLYLNGKNLCQRPLLERKEALRTLPFFNSVLKLSPYSLQYKTQLALASQSSARAILARDAHSFYSPGPSKKWLRIPLNDPTSSLPTERGPRLTHLNKIYWPVEEGTPHKITKGELIDYYRKMAPVLLPHLNDRPQSMHRHPEGIHGQGFFHKNLVEHHPAWVQTEEIFSHSTRKNVNYLLCQNEFTLLYMINLGCIELNPWLSRIGQLDRPDSIVIDLDPDDENSFVEVVEIAREFHKILDRIDVPHGVKTSGATGIHIYIPIQGRYPYSEAREFALAVSEVVHNLFRKNTSLERSPNKRRGRVYLDCFQNAQGQTVAAPYSVRPRPGAPVSTPLLWKEVTSRLEPREYTLFTVPKRIDQLGDLWKSFLNNEKSLSSFSLPVSLSSLRKNFPIK